MQPSYTAPIEPHSYKWQAARASAAWAISLRPEIYCPTTGARVSATIWHSVQHAYQHTIMTLQHIKSSNISLAVKGNQIIPTL